MDPLDRFFDGPRAARAFLMSVEMAAPWAIDVDDRAALTVILVSKGTAVVDGARLEAGDVALVRGPAPYRATDVDRSPTSVVIGPGQSCTSIDGRPLHETLAQGMRRWGNSAQPETVLIVGAYAADGEVGRMLTLGLPRLLVAPRTPAVEAMAAVLRHEVGRTGLGHQAILDRLLDALVVTALRDAVAERRHAVPSTWLTTTDPVAVAGLRALHAEPASPWTVASLAERAHVSRATFAARFRRGVGESPMAYLHRWRMALAAEHLADPEVSVAQAGRLVGFDNAFAFSTAFKRAHGVSPTAFRAHRSAPQPDAAHPAAAHASPAR